MLSIVTTSVDMRMDNASHTNINRERCLLGHVLFSEIGNSSFDCELSILKRCSMKFMQLQLLLSVLGPCSHFSLARNLRDGFQMRKITGETSYQDGSKTCILWTDLHLVH